MYCTFFASLDSIISGFVIFVRIPAAADRFFSVLKPDVTSSSATLPRLSNSLLFLYTKMKSYLYCGYSKQQMIVNNVLRAAQRLTDISLMTLHDDPSWLRKYLSQFLKDISNSHFTEEMNWRRQGHFASQLWWLKCPSGESQNALMWDDDHGQKHWNQSIAVLFEKRYVTKVSEILANADVTFMLWIILIIQLCKKKGS